MIKIFVKVILIILLAFSLVACGNGGEDAPPSEIVATQTPQPTPVPSPTPEPELPVLEYDEAQHSQNQDEQLIAHIVSAIIEGTRGLNPPLDPRPPAIGEINEDFYFDANFLVDLVERVHPIFGIPDLLDSDYERIRNEFIDYASRATNLLEFAFEMQRYVRVLRDSHMSRLGLWGFGNSSLNVAFDVKGDDLFLDDGRQVAAIGGVSISEIFKQIETYFFFENNAERNFILSIMSGHRTFLERLGVSGTYVTITTSDGVDIEAYHTEGLGLLYETDYNISYELKDDIFYISLRHFRRVYPQHNQTLDAISTAISDGIRHFIFDLRYNGGGSWDVVLDFFRAMEITPPGSGMFTAARPLDGDERPRILVTAPNVSVSDNPHGIIIAVLTNNGTYSAATVAASLIQDGGLGIIVGEPSTNAPSFFANEQASILPRIGVSVNISRSMMLRPDTSADQTTLWPDIPVDSDDALEAALEFFVNLGD